ncbi:MAG: SCO family protein [Gemmatimonadetes bacterium]|nr:MAG: SCO family protein [Gemmatimonadota bacterium]
MIHTSRLTVMWIALALLLALLALATSGCASQPIPGSRTSERSARAEDDVDRFSVYELDASWRDQSGATRSLASFRGSPVLLAMIYTHCTATCPLAVSELKRVAALDPDVRFVLVSLDPARDDASRLAHYAAERALEPSRWTLLTGSDADVRDLAATLGVRFRQVTPDDLAHTNLITLLDREGRITRQTSGPIDVAAIAELHATAR